MCGGRRGRKQGDFKQLVYKGKQSAFGAVSSQKDDLYVMRKEYLYWFEEVSVKFQTTSL